MQVLYQHKEIADHRSSLRTWVAAALCAAVLLSAAFLFLYQLGVQPLHNDEARYAEVVTESFKNNNYFELVYRDQPYFNKPPLLFWLIDASHGVVSDMQTAVRLPSAFGSILMVAATMLLVLEATSSLYAAALGGAIVTTSASLAILSRSGRFDSLATLCIVLSTYVFIRAFSDRRWFLLFGPCIGLAIMMKGPVAIFAITSACGVAWAYRRVDWIKDLYFWLGAVFAAIIVFPWYVYESVRYGMVFWNAYILQQILERAQENIVSIAQPLSNYDYASYFFEFLAPWTTIFVIAAIIAPILWPKFSLKVRALLTASFIEITSVLIICLCVQSKAYRYLIPLYPFIAVVVAIVGLEVFRTYKNIRVPLIIAFIILGMGAFVWTAYNGFLLNPAYPYSTDTPASAYDEKQVADIFLARHAKTFYVYDTADIGGIMYYSHLINPYYFPLYGYYPGLYFVLPASEVTIFQNSHPRLQFRILYKGSDLVLGQELIEARECLVAPICDQ